MGGDTGRVRSRTAREKERAINWLQWIIDCLASEYGWTKDHIFSLYPAEIEILQKQIAERRERDEDYDLIRQLIAARAPMTKDAGMALIKQLQAKHKNFDDGGGVTPEQRKRDLARFRKKLAGLNAKR